MSFFIYSGGPATVGAFNCGAGIEVTAGYLTKPTIFQTRKPHVAVIKSAYNEEKAVMSMTRWWPLPPREAAEICANAHSLSNLAQLTPRK